MTDTTVPTDRPVIDGVRGLAALSNDPEKFLEMAETGTITGVEFVIPAMAVVRSLPPLHFFKIRMTLSNSVQYTFSGSGVSFDNCFFLHPEYQLPIPKESSPLEALQIEIADLQDEVSVLRAKAEEP